MLSLRRVIVELSFRIHRWLWRAPVEVMDARELEKLLREQRPEYDFLRLDRPLSKLNTIIMDGKFYYTDVPHTVEMFVEDVSRLRLYAEERYDCDNFAMAFAGTVPLLYGINPAGVAVGPVFDLAGNYRFYHAWNVVLAMRKNGEPVLFSYEPQTGMFGRYGDGKVWRWIYVPEMIIWG